MNLTDLLLNVKALLEVSALAILLLASVQLIDRRVHLSTRLRGVVAVGAVITCLGCLYFFSLYWNHFLGLRSGNGAFGGGSVISRVFVRIVITTVWRRHSISSNG